jgi:hypothetical protein
MAWRTLGMVAEKLGKPVSLKDRQTSQIIDYDLEACFDRSAKIFADAEIEMEKARTLREWAKASFRSGNPEQGERLWYESRQIFARLGADLEVQRMESPPA